MAYVRQGKFKEALSDFETMIKKCEPHSSNLYYRGLAYQYLGQLDAALADYTYRPKERKSGYYDLGSEFFDLQIGIIQVKKGSKEPAVGSKLRWAITRLPKNIEARTTYIFYLLHAGYPKGADDELEKLKELDPKAAADLEKILKQTGMRE